MTRRFAIGSHEPGGEWSNWPLLDIHVGIVGSVIFIVPEHLAFCMVLEGAEEMHSLSINVISIPITGQINAVTRVVGMTSIVR